MKTQSIIKFLLAGAVVGTLTLTTTGSTGRTSGIQY